MPVRSPLYEASHAARYERQSLIRQYQATYRCRLVVMQDVLFPHSTLASAQAIIAAVDRAEERIQQSPDTYPLHAFLLEPVTALMVQQARDAIDRTGDLVKEALACVTRRSPEETESLAESLEKPLIGDSKNHGAVVSATDATGFGLPVEQADPASDRWQAVWRLWMKYAVLNAVRVYEGQTASYVVPQPAGHAAVAT